jgi:hypothetical protein
VAEPIYSFDTPYPADYQAGRVNVAEMVAYRSGAEVTPSAATYRLIAPNGNDVVATAAASLSGAVASYSLSGAVLDTALADISWGSGYTERWTLTLAGVPIEIGRPAVLVKTQLRPSVSDNDLIDIYPLLPTLRGATRTTSQGFLDSAWGTIIRRWINEGNAQGEVASPGVWFEPHLHLALSMELDNIALMRPESGAGDAAERHRARYEAAWSQITVIMDRDNDGQADDATKRERRGQIVHRNVSPNGRGAWRRMPARLGG